jgi:hypothetical protein
MSSEAMANNDALATTLQKAHELHNNGEHNTMQRPQRYEATVSSATQHDSHDTMMRPWAPHQWQATMRRTPR